MRLSQLAVDTKPGSSVNIPIFPDRPPMSTTSGPTVPLRTGISRRCPPCSSMRVRVFSLMLAFLVRAEDAPVSGGEPAIIRQTPNQRTESAGGIGRAQKRASCGDALSQAVTIEQAASGAHSAVLAAELVDPAAGIDDLLLARVERVALGTDFDMQFLAQRGARLEGVAAAADDLDLLVLGMRVRLHVRPSGIRNMWKSSPW